MGITPFAGVTKLPSRTHAKLPIPTGASLPIGTNAKMPNENDAALPGGTSAKIPSQRSSAVERQRRLEEAMAFLRQHLAAGPQPTRALLKAARDSGIAARTLHRAKDALSVRPERSGGYGAHGQWTWYPLATAGQASTTSARKEQVVAS